MVKLNLLPPEERTKKKIIKENLWALFLSFIAIISMAGFVIFLIMIQTDFDLDTKKLDNDITTQKEENSEYKDTEEAVKTLNENIELITKLENQNIRWSDILKEIRSRIPTNATLTEIAITLESDNNKTDSGIPMLTLEGTSVNLFPIAKFRESLSGSDRFTYVDFESASANEESIVYGFILKLKIKTNNER